MLEDAVIPVVKKKQVNSYETKYYVGGISGDAVMDCMIVYPGIQVIHNRFHSFDTPSNSTGEKRHIEINHCLRGKYEGMLDKKYYAYLSPGELSVSKWSMDRGDESFPLGYYEGMEILIDLERAVENPVLSYFHIDLEELEQRLLSSHNLVLFGATDQIQHIFLEMYEVEENIKLDYLKIKVLELLLFLSNTDFKIPQRSRSYYPRKQIELIKEMKKYMAEHLSEHHDIRKLAEAYHINVHTLRKTFKDIYGVAIYRWLKEYRMECSAKLLLETRQSILEIANQVGYSNPSKYTEAFVKSFGITPQKYRKSHIKMDGFQ